MYQLSFIRTCIEFVYLNLDEKKFPMKNLRMKDSGRTEFAPTLANRIPLGYCT